MARVSSNVCFFWRAIGRFAQKFFAKICPHRKDLVQMQSYSFELRFPGTRIDGLDDEKAFLASLILQAMSTVLLDAAYALTAFEASSAEAQPPRNGKAFDAQNPMLKALVRRRPFIYAKTFVSSLDILEKHLANLETMLDDPSSIIRARVAFKSTLPDLRGVRDSVQHAEERVQGKARKKKIQTQPIDKLGIKAPGGGVFVNEMLSGNVFAYTTANGELGEVPISEDSFSAAVQAVQAAIDSFVWLGPSSMSPS